MDALTGRGDKNLYNDKYDVPSLTFDQRMQRKRIEESCEFLQPKMDWGTVERTDNDNGIDTMNEIADSLPQVAASEGAWRDGEVESMQVVQEKYHIEEQNSVQQKQEQ
jgi:hypothetical protein